MRLALGLVLLAAPIAGCSLTGMFEDEPFRTCTEGDLREGPCGLCGHSTRVEVCGSDGVWEPRPCDPDPDDSDGDGAASTECAPGVPLDCDDSDSRVHPGGPERCNAADDDCVWGPCAPATAAGACLVAGACHADGQVSPTDPCAVCDSSRSTISWSSRGCWWDPDRALMWEDPPGAARGTWQDARSYCDALVLLGHDDWHLPTIDELRSMVRGCPHTMPGGICGVTDACLDGTCFTPGCDSCSVGVGPGASGCYWDPTVTAAPCDESWSSSSYAADESSPSAWIIDFYRAHVLVDVKAEGSFAARCVRSGP